MEPEISTISWSSLGSDFFQEVPVKMHIPMRTVTSEHIHLSTASVQVS